MHRQKGTLNTPQSIIAEIVIRHKAGRTIADLAKEYRKTYETVNSMIKRENKKDRHVEAGVIRCCSSKEMKITGAAGNSRSASMKPLAMWTL